MNARSTKFAAVMLAVLSLVWGYSWVTNKIGILYSSPFDFAATPTSIRTPPPLLGEHSDEILAELGFDAASISRMRGSGAV